MQITNCSAIHFIKLGKKGEWERKCIEDEGTLRLGFGGSNHQDCLNGKWDRVYQTYLQGENKKTPAVATGFVNQIKKFYQADEKVLWITFWGDRMWWCFSKPQIKLLTDKSKIRPVIGRWHDTTVDGKTLLTTKNLRGDLLKTQGFRGTICDVKIIDYVLKKINGQELEEVKRTNEVMLELQRRVATLITKLRWQDFEVLIDLIFREAGYNRTGDVGKTQKTFDLDLMSPVTGERCMVQVKSQSNLEEFEEDCKEFEAMKGYDKFFYVVHSPDESLKKVRGMEGRVKVMQATDLAQVVIDSGLVRWLASKVG
jgi:hypothetical protein